MELHFVSITAKDDNLISMALQGDQEALHLVFTRCRRLLYDHRILRNHEEAADAVQSCLLLASRNFLKGESSFRSWLTRVLINQALAISARKSADPRQHRLRFPEFFCPGRQIAMM